MNSKRMFEEGWIEFEGVYIKARLIVRINR